MQGDRHFEDIETSFLSAFDFNIFFFLVHNFKMVPRVLNCSVNHMTIPGCLYMMWQLLVTVAWSSVIWTASSEFGTHRLCEQRRFRLYHYLVFFGWVSR